MGHYSEHAYGADISTVYGDLSEEAQERFDAGTWGTKQYGSGYGRITYLGVEVPCTRKGIIVTPEIEEKTAKIYEAIPENVRREICGALRRPARGPHGQRGPSLVGGSEGKARAGSPAGA